MIRSPEQENSVERHLMIDYVEGAHPGSFVSYLTKAFLNADHDNFEKLRPIIRDMISKYDVKCTCENKVVPNW